MADSDTPDLSLKEFAIFINGAELNQAQYQIEVYDDNGIYKIKVVYPAGFKSSPRDYVLVWKRTPLTVDDINFATGARISSTKLNEILKSFYNRLEELRSAGFAFASSSMFEDLAEAMKTVLDQHTAAKKTELDVYVSETLESQLDAYESTKETELDNYTNTKKTELDNYEAAKETELDNYTNTKKTELDNYKLTKESELDNHTNTKKIELDDYVDNTLKPELNTYVESLQQAQDLIIDGGDLG